jgi:uncharacterized coiled-coil protein SlyX
MAAVAPVAGAVAASPSAALVSLMASDFATVHLRDGREFTGRVLEETPNKITLEVTISGITVEMTFGANEVRTIERLEAREAPARPEREREARPEASGGEGGWVVFPAHGTIGVELTKNFFESCISRAVNVGAEVAVFDLKSPGGYLYSLDEIYNALQAQSGNIDIVFYVDGGCFSAAALLCITSDAFFVGPNASFGSAVIIQDDGSGGADAVNAKYASAQAAIWRTRAERRERPGLLVNAMMLLEAELWADKSTSPWTLYASQPGVDAGSAELVDNDKSILSMTASEAVALGAADDSRSSIEELLSRLDLRNPEREATSGSAHARNVIRNQQRRINDLEQRVNFIDSVIDRINDGIEDESITIDSFRRDLIRVRSSLDRIRREMEQTDYVRFYCLLNGVTEESIAEYKQLIDETLRQLR